MTKKELVDSLAIFPDSWPVIVVPPAAKMEQMVCVPFLNISDTAHLSFHKSGPVVALMLTIEPLQRRLFD